MTLTIREIAKELGLSPRTVYRYVEEHRAFLEVSREGKRLLIGRESLSLLRTITDLYRQGMTSGQVQMELGRLNSPVVIQAGDGDTLATVASTGDVLGLLLSEVRDLCRQRDAESQERALLLEMLRQQNQELASLRDEMVELRKTLEPAEVVVEPEAPVAVVATPRRRSIWSWFRGSREAKGDASTGT